MLKRLLEKPWRIISRGLRTFGNVQIALLLGIFYYLILCPFALIYQAVGSFRKIKSQRSYWIKRITKTISEEELLKQF